MAQERKRPHGAGRAPGVARAGGLPCGRWRPRRRGRRRCRRTSGASRRRRRRPPNSSSASARRRRQRAHPDRLGRGRSRPQGGAFDWCGVDTLVDGAAAGRHRRAARSSPARPSWAVPPVGVPGGVGARRRTTCRSRPAPQRTAWTNFLTQAVAPLRARRQPSGPPTRRAGTADPHLADLERAELQVLRRPAQPGRIRQAGQHLLRGDQERSIPGRS